jgi:hypothetical protein
MHPWYSRINDFELCQKRDDILYEEKCGLNFPDFIVFDLILIFIQDKKEKVKNQNIIPRGSGPLLR